MEGTETETSSARLLRWANEAAAAGKPWPEKQLLGEATGTRVAVAPLNVLIAIKKSHTVFPVNWEKHMADYHELIRIAKAAVSCVNLDLDLDHHHTPAMMLTPVCRVAAL